VNLLRASTMIQRAVAPEKMRTNVKLAASMRVCLSAARQRSELLANAIIVSNVRMKMRGFRKIRFRPHRKQQRNQRN
jgi:hypothetical protein